MNKNLKRLMLLTVMLGSWFLTADAYWVAKEREERKCEFEKKTELLKYGKITQIYQDEIPIRRYCSLAMGAGYYWNSTDGMAYWEIIFLAPVMYRFREIPI